MNLRVLLKFDHPFGSLDVLAWIRTKNRKKQLMPWPVIFLQFSLLNCLSLADFGDSFDSWLLPKRLLCRNWTKIHLKSNCIFFIQKKQNIERTTWPIVIYYTFCWNFYKLSLIEILKLFWNIAQKTYMYNQVLVNSFFPQRMFKDKRGIWNYHPISSKRNFWIFKKKWYNTLIA